MGQSGLAVQWNEGRQISVHYLSSPNSDTGWPCFLSANPDCSAYQPHSLAWFAVDLIQKFRSQEDYLRRIKSSELNRHRKQHLRVAGLLLVLLNEMVQGLDITQGLQSLMEYLRVDEGWHAPLKTPDRAPEH